MVIWQQVARKRRLRWWKIHTPVVGEGAGERVGEGEMAVVVRCGSGRGDLQPSSVVAMLWLGLLSTSSQAPSVRADLMV